MAPTPHTEVPPGTRAMFTIANGLLAAITARCHLPADSCQIRLGTSPVQEKQLPTAHRPPLPSSARSLTLNFCADVTAGRILTVQPWPFQCPTASVVPFLAFLP